MIFLLTFIFGFLKSHKYTNANYKDLANKYSFFNSVCIVRNVKTGCMMTGVLIKPNIIITCAHGFSKNARATNSDYYYINLYEEGWQAVFPTGVYNITYSKVSKEYYEIRPELNKGYYHSRFDLAICKLDRCVLNVDPIPIVNPLELKDDTLLLSGTYTNGEICGYQLCEFTKINIPGVTDYMNDRVFMYGSIFFNPEGEAYLNNIFLPEKEQRASLARYNWQKYDKLPFALSMPGCSGSPVFAVINDKAYLFGIVMGFTTLSKQFQSPYKNEVAFLKFNNKKKLEEKIYDNYQTLITVFFDENMEIQDRYKFLL